MTIRQVGFSQVAEYFDMDYIDNDIAVYEDFRSLPAREEGAVQMAMSTIVVCTQGRLQVTFNGMQQTLERNDLIVLRSNTLLENCMLSPDFKGSILCLSDRLIMDCLADDTMWTHAFQFLANPVIHLTDSDVHLFNTYKELYKLKRDAPTAKFRKEIILTLIHAILLELLASAGASPQLPQGATSRQRDVLFKRFMLLVSSNKVKPRNVAWYAGELCVSPKHLSSVCKQVSGRTALDIITEYVEIDVRRMLKSSDMSVKEIAATLQFPNISFFGKYCRAHFGLSPTRLRQQMREEE